MRVKRSFFFVYLITPLLKGEVTKYIFNYICSVREQIRINHFTEPQIAKSARGVYMLYM